MTTFDDRKNAFEKKYAHDEEMLFKAVARRNRLVGLWAAELLGKSGSEADAYAKEIVLADLKLPGPDDVIERLEADLGARADAATIRAKLDELLPVAKAQLIAELDDQEG
ncbi:DUF1476 domain-containing protein [Pontibaca methylaminivorans]|uniref:DUF1476 domain-containing protein n=1 Tax=Pontibaca methylaminivorans TaxID=515897 RepID=A0A1R3X181_9RHOB|nr:DUF1476 domain-containing protein [Pontibaca methylaminivorans]SIT84587.1 hypothetical protein SAMN05421849_2143 [Pontibaca methylaminivorans]